MHAIQKIDQIKDGATVTAVRQSCVNVLGQVCDRHRATRPTAAALGVTPLWERCITVHST